jgi:FxLD family lantipeptide
MSPAIDAPTTPVASPMLTAGPNAEPILDSATSSGFDIADFDLDIRVFESGVGLDEIIRMTDDGCGSTCQSACNSC